jgi:segregation and condensation protein B
LERIDSHVESLVFSAETPISILTIKKCLDRLMFYDFPLEDIETSLSRLKLKYEEGDFSFNIVEINEGYLFMTKPYFHNTVSMLLKEKSNKKLTKVALETLSIIAYKQPISRTMIESIRGVNCEYTLQKLLEKELVEISGRAEGPGRPLLYRTSEKFMNYFGLRSIKDLPTLKDFNEAKEQVGEPSPIEIVRNDKYEEE